MAYKKTQYNYHDGQLQDFKVGPGNELILTIYLDPFWNKNSPEVAIVRFGAIQNITEVVDFFECIKEGSKRGDFWCDVIGIVYENRNRWIVDLETYGSIILNSSKISES